MDKALAVSICLLFGSTADAQTKVVLQGTPLYHIVVKPDTVTRERVPESRRQSARCLITKSLGEDTYRWLSRDDNQIFALQSGVFTNFVGVSGVVRVGNMAEIKRGFMELVAPRLTDLSVEEAEALLWNEHFLLASPELRSSPIAYMEILWKGLGLVIYLGVADELDL
jgi:hypothetical protein